MSKQKPYSTLYEESYETPHYRELLCWYYYTQKKIKCKFFWQKRYGGEDKDKKRKQRAVWNSAFLNDKIWFLLAIIYNLNVKYLLILIL